MNKIITVLILACTYFILPAQTPELRIPAAHECTEYIFSKDDQTLVTLGKNEVKIPYKKSKKHPLTSTQKQENKEMSSQRIAVENALGNQKRYFILRNENRSANKTKIQEEVWVCAGLANFKSKSKLNY